VDTVAIADPGPKKKLGNWSTLAYEPPWARIPHSLLWGILAFSRELLNCRRAGLMVSVARVLDPAGRKVDLHADGRRVDGGDPACKVVSHTFEGL